MAKVDPALELTRVRALVKAAAEALDKLIAKVDGIRDRLSDVDREAIKAQLAALKEKLASIGSGTTEETEPPAPTTLPA